ncbi:MAG: NAD(P)/FAD-dependent oxidoreductase, partial [Pseudomonadota bacterium]
IVPNLYFAGEILDVDGITGGFNFQNAWTTSWICAQSVVDKLKNDNG